MPSLRHLPRSYANIVSSLALFIALGGGAYAASGGFVGSGGTVRFCVNKGGTTTVVKAGKKCKKGTTTLVLNQQGVPGKNGAEGKQGATGPATGAAGGDLTGNYPNPLIGTAKVTTTALADKSVTTTKLADESVTTTQLANNAVTSAKIQDGQVRAGDLGNIVTVTNEAPIANGGLGTVLVTCPTGTLVISGGFQPGVFGVEATSSLKSGSGWEYQAKNNSGAPSIITVFAYCLEA